MVEVGTATAGMEIQSRLYKSYSMPFVLGHSAFSREPHRERVDESTRLFGVVERK